MSRSWTSTTISYMRLGGDSTSPRCRDQPTTSTQGFTESGDDEPPPPPAGYQNFAPPPYVARQEVPMRRRSEDLTAEEKISCDDLIALVHLRCPVKNPNAVTNNSRKAFWNLVFDGWDTDCEVSRALRQIPNRQGAASLALVGYAARDLVSTTAGSPNRHHPFARAQNAPQRLVRNWRRQGAPVYLKVSLNQTQGPADSRRDFEDLGGSEEPQPLRNDRPVTGTARSIDDRIMSPNLEQSSAGNTNKRKTSSQAPGPSPGSRRVYRQARIKDPGYALNSRSSVTNK
ncbi:hypothetical protein CONLIGDRAFT_645990 [Coniochaeta ligniaria NRRL 30616]|uniref:Uncharacterized protein n=1 Tax=Coniochaeta ligniaria NRRL 30616 TaxID=1408157 RepID=A0A1J7JDG0_9PEZI|nr:hypothetical protein CONLIGDRAFT_645990 [Coniochaeta ligniaria NRRL 30616]